MTPSRSFRVLFVASMLASMAVVIVWAGVVGWRMWPEWRAVREMRAAVEANEPGRFLDAVEAVDQLGVAEAAADEIAPLCHHAEPRVRMYAVMARTVLGSRGPSEAGELIAVFDDPDEDIAVRRAAGCCLARLGEHARAAVPSFKTAALNKNDPRRFYPALRALIELGREITGPLPSEHYGEAKLTWKTPAESASRVEVLEYLVWLTDNERWINMSRRFTE